MYSTPGRISSGQPSTTTYSPPGDYHINPPFHEGVLDAVAAIVKSSFESGAAIRAVVVVPRWRDAAFIATLGSVRCVCCRVLERRRFEYEHFNGGRPRTDTLFYCMVDAGRYPLGDEEFFAACEGLVDGVSSSSDS